MAAPTLVPITPVVLAWAIDEAGLTDKEVAHRCQADTSEVDAWRTGDAQPTKTQFNKLVTLLRRPTAFFFLPEPPDDLAVPPSFRRPPGDDEARRISRDEANAVRTARRLQRVSGWILKEEGVTPRAIPHATTAEAPQEVANRVTEFLHWSVVEQCEARDSSAVTNLLRSRLEEFGFLVLHLPLGEKGCRGFSLYDQYAPVIAINTAYNAGARVYSYGHEVGHLVLHSDSICTSTGGRSHGIERWCEEFAAAFFMPHRHLAAFVASNLRGDGSNFKAVQRVASRFKVSLRAAALQLIRTGYAKPALYAEVDHTADYKTKKGGGGGETSPEKRLREWGSIYPRLLFDAEQNSLLTRHDLLEYLNLSNTQLTTLHQQLIAVGADSD